MSKSEEDSAVRWNYRVIKLRDGSVGIASVFYKKDGSITAYVNPVIIEDDIGELMQTLLRMEGAVTKAQAEGPLLESELEAMFMEVRDEPDNE